jgi:hypothetical protein
MMQGVCGELETLAMPSAVEPPQFAWKDSRPSRIGANLEQLAPVRRAAAGRFRVPPVAAREWKSVNLRPLARPVRPDPGMNLEGSRGAME